MAEECGMRFGFVKREGYLVFHLVRIHVYTHTYT